MTKQARRLVATEVGRLVFSYADEIVGLGSDLLNALAHRPTDRPMRLVVGIDDVVPKEIVPRLLGVLRLEQPTPSICREGILEYLLAALRLHEVDADLSDSPVTPSLNDPAYNHMLGTCGESWMAVPAKAKSLRPGFRNHCTEHPFCK